MKKSLLITTILFLALLLVGCATKKQPETSFEEFAYDNQEHVNLNAAQHEQVGDGFLRRGKPEMAFVHYNRALQMDPELAEVRIKKGNLLVEKGLDEQGLAEFLHVLKSDPDHAIANEAAGAVYFRAGLYAEAQAHLTKAVAQNPMLWKAHNYLGNLHGRQGDYVKACASYRQALELHKGQCMDEIYNNLGVAQMAMKEYTSAVESFRYALKNGGVSPRTYNNLGLALTRLGRMSEALQSFGYAGGESKAHNNLGYVLLTDGKPAEAVPYFERAVELAPSYYVKAAENLKRARMAARFVDAPLAQQSGSTPNPLSGTSFPAAGQTPGESAATPVPADSPTTGNIRRIAHVPGDGDQIIEKAWGLHVSSWRDHSWAFDHCEKLADQGFKTWINQVDLDEKGIWYRVMVGRYDSEEQARLHKQAVMDTFKLESVAVYELVEPKPDGSHMKVGQ